MNRGNIFVTGGTGFIGSHLVRYLTRRGYSVTTLVRPTSSTQFLPKSNVKIATGDIRYIDTLSEAMKDCTVVFHNAAFTSDWGNKAEFSDNNVSGTMNVLMAAQAQGIKSVILTSTNGVIGEEDCSEAKDEDSPYRPRIPYFLSSIFESDMNHYRYTKMVAEKQAVDFCTVNNISLTVIRPVWVYGPREFHAGPYYFCKTVLQGTRLLPGCKTNKFHVVYVEDLVNAMIIAMEKRLKGIHVFTIGGYYVPTMDEFWRLFCKYLKVDMPHYTPKWLIYPVGLAMEIVYKWLGKDTSPVLTRARVYMCYANNIYNIKRAKKILNFEVKTPLEYGVRKTVKWWKLNKYL